MRFPFALHPTTDVLGTKGPAQPAVPKRPAAKPAPKPKLSPLEAAKASLQQDMDTAVLAIFEVRHPPAGGWHAPLADQSTVPALSRPTRHLAWCGPNQEYRELLQRTMEAENAAFGHPQYSRKDVRNAMVECLKRARDRVQHALRPQMQGSRGPRKQDMFVIRYEQELHQACVAGDLNQVHAGAACGSHPSPRNRAPATSLIPVLWPRSRRWSRRKKSPPTRSRTTISPRSSWPPSAATARLSNISSTKVPPRPRAPVYCQDYLLLLCRSFPTCTAATTHRAGADVNQPSGVLRTLPLHAAAGR